ncbi:ribosomal protein S5 domain 2-type protein, partial [Cantharellus anzutake]|uniref:ribosomal protein S5 domain 2-type protein n=1 Tax=Cantharellus anzutake TaxID=1750568 RepID=UPI001904B346
SRPEILSDHGFRSDGRKSTELRSLNLELASHTQADGSATVSHGLTSVLVTIHGPKEPRLRSSSVHDRATINVSVDAPSFSGQSSLGNRRGRGDKRMLEFAANIRSTFEPVIQTALYPRSNIDINVQVLQSDGSLLQTAINATTLALVDAGIAMTDLVCAITCGLYDATPLLDLTSIEEADIPHLTVGVLPRSGKASLVTLETHVVVDRFMEMLRLTGEAANAIHAEMTGVVLLRTDRLASAMSSGGQPVVTGVSKVPMDVDYEMNER